MFYYILLFLLGAAVGSFLNVLIDRLSRGEGFLFSRSRCENCDTPLPAYDLIPLFSFLWLGGKCRFCGVKIPERLPLVELVAGLGFVFVYRISLDSQGFLADPRGFYPLLFVTYYLLLFSSFVVLFFTDLEYSVLPDQAVLPSIVLALVWRGVGSFLAASDFRGLMADSFGYLFPALGLAGFFLMLIAITRGRGMGFGDVKLGFLIGLVLGWPETLVAAFLAFLFGGVVSAILLISGKKHFGEEVPFGPFLILATAVAALFGSWIWEWYLGML